MGGELQKGRASFLSPSRAHAFLVSDLAMTKKAPPPTRNPSKSNRAPDIFFAVDMTMMPMMTRRIEKTIRGIIKIMGACFSNPTSGTAAVTIVLIVSAIAFAIAECARYSERRKKLAPVRLVADV